MSVYHLQPPDEPKRPPPQRMLFGAALIFLFISLVGGALFWLGGARLPMAPTPTLTATPAPARSATPDFRATRFAEDQQTAVAYYARATRQAPVSINMPVIGNPAQGTPTAVSASPLLPAGGNAPTATPIGASPLDPTAIALAAQTLTPIGLPAVLNQPSPLATPTPPPPTDIPTATLPPPVDAPTATPTEPPTPTPTATPYWVTAQRATVRQTSAAPLYQAPIRSSLSLGSVPANTVITLVGRDETGEWVVDNNNRWLRQAYVVITGNQLGTGAPQDANPNDVRWLPTRTWPANVTPMPPPTPTLIPFDDFPNIRYDRANTARLPGTFRNNMLVDVFNSAQAAQGPSAPLIVVGPHVLLATNDGRIYSFDKNSTGNQLRIFTLGPRVKFPPVAQDSIVYLVDEQNRISALNLNTDPPSLVWQSSVVLPTTGAPINATTGAVVAGNRLYLAAASGEDQYVLQYNRENGQVQTSKFEAKGPPFQPFGVGHQLLYVTGSKVWALDLETLELIWERDLQGVLPPLYAYNGLGALAELYIVNGSGRIFHLDANTGSTVREYDSGNEAVRGLALGNPQIYAAGTGFIKAYDRRNNALLWRQSTYGDVLSGPFVTAGQVLLITTNGQVQFFDPNNGGLPSIGPSAPVGAGAAVAGNLIFIPDSGGRIAKFREQ